MRQRLPETAGYPLIVNDIGRTIYPGEEFDCPLPVPGCESLEPPEDAPEGGAGDGEGNGGGAPQDQPGEPGDSKPAAKGRASGRGA